MQERFGDGVPGRWIIVSSWVCTAVFTLAAVPALIDPQDAVALDRETHP